MDYKKTLRKIKLALRSKVNVKSVYLFDSRARGDFYPDSDSDLADTLR